MRTLTCRVATLQLMLAGAAACSSSSGGSVATAADGGPIADAGSSDAADAGTADGGTATSPGDVSGAYGATPIAPIAAAYWIGMPGNPAESGGGPFVYLFSAPVTCADLSKGSGWLTTIPAGTQVLEMIIGTTTPGTTVSAAAHAAAGAAEVNYAAAGSTAESRATSGTVTLVAYTKDASVDGLVDVTFQTGQAKGSFHATWCPTGNEL